MDVKLKFREMVKYRAGALCLVGILSATYLHSTSFMSQFFYHSIILGGIAAFAIDAGVVAMSIFKDELLKDGELAWMVRVVTSLVLFASGIANMSEGFRSAYGIQLTEENLMLQDWLTITQWLAGTVIFPILAYVMADTIGTRNLIEFKAQAAAAADPKTKKAGRLSLPTNGQGYQAPTNGHPSPNGASANFSDIGNQKIRKNKQERLQILEEYLDEYPDASLSEMAAAVGVASRETIRLYLQELGHNGRGRKSDKSKKSGSMGFQK